MHCIRFRVHLYEGVRIRVVSVFARFFQVAEAVHTGHPTDHFSHHVNVFLPVRSHRALPTHPAHLRRPLGALPVSARIGRRAQHAAHVGHHACCMKATHHGAQQGCAT